MSCHLEGRDKSLDRKFYSQARKEKGKEGKEGVRLQGATCVKNAVAQLGPKLCRTPASLREGRQGSSAELFRDVSIRAVLI